MKLALFHRDGEGPAIGAVTENGIVALRVAAPNLPRDILAIVASGVEVLAEETRSLSEKQTIPLDSVRLLAPMPIPPEFIGVGLNYRDHLSEATIALPAAPTVFNKQTSCIAGPYDDIVLPDVSDQLDYEGELGIVIGRAGRNLSRVEAAKAIFGYLIVNDVSVRDWQFSSPTVTLGKSFDTHGPMGPWIVTADEIPDPQKLTLTTTVNGEVRQHASTADMIFDCFDIVAFLSQVMTLRPGTVITTGTPAGVGHFHKPPAYLRAGDMVSVEISGIGRIANRVVKEERRMPR